MGVPSVEPPRDYAFVPCISTCGDLWRYLWIYIVHLSRVVRVRVSAELIMKMAPLLLVHRDILAAFICLMDLL